MNKSRERASGPLSLREIEDIWTTEIGDMATHTGWLDNHLALWAPSLDPFTDLFARDGLPMLRSQFRERGSDAAYYSIMVHCPQSMLVLQLISNVSSNGGTWPPAPPQHWFEGMCCLPTTQHTMTMMCCNMFHTDYFVRLCVHVAVSQ